MSRLPHVPWPSLGFDPRNHCCLMVKRGQATMAVLIPPKSYYIGTKEWDGMSVDSVLFVVELRRLIRVMAGNGDDSEWCRNMLYSDDSDVLWKNSTGDDLLRNKTRFTEDRDAAGINRLCMALLYPYFQRRK
jgi:hypothetical protein